MKRVEFGRDVLSLLVKSLKTSHSNEQAYRDECIRNLSTNYQNLQVRINRLYDDFLDGRITKEMHDQRAKQLREDQDCLTEEIHAHEHAERNFIDDGILLLELAQKAHSYYVEETPAEKSRLLKILHSNSSWKDGALTTTYRSPFDLIADANRECEERGEVAVGENGLSPTWLALVEDVRTRLYVPIRTGKRDAKTLGVRFPQAA